MNRSYNVIVKSNIFSFLDSLSEQNNGPACPTSTPVNGGDSLILSPGRGRDLCEKLLAALQNEDLPEVNRLLDLSHPYDIFQALPEAWRAGLKSCVDTWITRETNLDPTICQTLLKPAILSGCTESVKALLNRGADLNLPRNSRYPVLFFAITYLDQPDLIEMVKFLVEKGADLEARNDFDRTPLLEAAYTEKTDVINVLNEKGADMTAVDNNDNSALHILMEQFSEPEEEILRLFASQYNQFSRYGMTPLMLAAEKCNAKSVKILLKLGADPKMANLTGDTALHWATDTEMTCLLIQAGADLEARGRFGRTPLLKAACTGNTDVINELKKYGAVMTAVDDEGNSALHMMVGRIDESVEETFRIFAFQCNQSNKKGMTPLMLAAKKCHTKAVRILLKLGADPHIVNYKSWQPHTALSLLLDRNGMKRENSYLICAEELIKHNSVTSLPRCCSYFFKMIDSDQRRLVQLMVTQGMAPLCENSQTVRNIIPVVVLRDVPSKVSPLALALVLNTLDIAQYLTENWFLTPADLVGSLELRYLRSELERKSQADSLRFMDENLSQPMSLFKLSFVAVSAQLGGVTGREERVSQIPLPNILKDMLLFRCENFPMDFTDRGWFSSLDDEDDEFEEGISDYDSPHYSSFDDEDSEFESDTDSEY
ncbi:ankyrin repeat-containing domain [Plakobranchus ocellatus]|uniref:Ankyrin repeat-containing domain n=1 Tax=Plakobranchus ocellatus TaxID=259542 RepID=A0AAV4AKS0_9GAST|nr:ankyrin repeat-containing domain [Plakobranchus ocellatus]